MKKLVVFVLISFLNISIANASKCSNEELVKLKKEASNIKMAYEEKEKPMSADRIPPETEEGEEFFDPYFTISVTNADSKMYIVLTNDYNDDKKRIYYSDTKDGIYTFDWDNVFDIVKFKYEVYSSDQTSCPSEKLFTGYLVTPKRNMVSETLYCLKAPELKACQKYITEDVPYTKLLKQLEDYFEEKEKKEQESGNKVWNFIKKHKVVVIASTVLIISGVASVIVLKNRRGSDGL